VRHPLRLEIAAARAALAGSWQGRGLSMQAVQAAERDLARLLRRLRRVGLRDQGASPSASEPGLP
jgi:hypothetical protein